MSALRNVSSKKLQATYERMNREWHKAQNLMYHNIFDTNNPNGHVAAYYKDRRNNLNMTIDRINREMMNRIRYS